MDQDDVSGGIYSDTYIIYYLYGRSRIDGVTSVALRRRTEDKERERSRNCGLPGEVVGEWRSTLFFDYVIGK